MSVEVVSEASSGGDVYRDYADNDERESVVVEFCGRRRNLCQSRETNKFSGVFENQYNGDSSLQNKSIIRKAGPSIVLRPMEAGGTVTVEINIEWGKGEGTSCSGAISAEAHDDNGNFAKIEVKQDSSGAGKASVSAGHEEESSEK